MPILVCELTRCCLLGMTDADRFEVLRWDAFTLLKLHRLVDKIINQQKVGRKIDILSGGDYPASGILFAHVVLHMGNIS